MTDLPRTRFRNGRSLLALFTLALLAFMIEPTQGQSDYRVGLVVRHSNGEVVKQCVDIGAPTASGYDVLIASGLDLSIEAQSMGTVICSINGEGCSFPQESCFCACMSSPCTYWSYWQRQDDQWIYANLGASQSTVAAGSVEGWSWGEGTINASADYPPPDVSYAEICEPEDAGPGQLRPRLPPRAQPWRSRPKPPPRRAQPRLCPR